MKAHAHFRFIHMPCCGQLLCWVNPRARSVRRASSPWPGSGAGGATAGIAERDGAVRVGRGRALRASRSVTKRLGAVAVGGDRADGPPAGVAERGLLCLRRDGQKASHQDNQPRT
jgi:hypothetical protein